MASEQQLQRWAAALEVLRNHKDQLNSVDRELVRMYEATLEELRQECLSKREKKAQVYGRQS